MGLLLTKREFSPPFITLPLLHPFCSPKGWMLQCEKPCVCLVSLEYVTRCDKPPPTSPQRCLQMQINFPHTLQPQTNSEDKLLARNVTTFCSSICWKRRRMLCFWDKKYLFVRLLYCWKFCSHQFEVRGRGEMLALAFSESSLQINLRSPAPAAHSSCEWEFKGSHFNN